jgi:hypothetical protein
VFLLIPPLSILAVASVSVPCTVDDGIVDDVVDGKGAEAGVADDDDRNVTGRFATLSR